jgi:thioesterase domain-containing protein
MNTWILTLAQKYTMKQRSPGGITDTLMQIWERVLQRTAIASEDDFFELGGDAWRAVELFHEIEAKLHRTFPPLVIYQAPTIASLARLLEMPNEPQIPQCVLLKNGDFRTPIFLAHGLGGNLFEFFDFAKYVQSSHAIYGLQARGTDGLEEPCSSIEEMAEFHIHAITVLQPHGPYVLVGYSLGGLVALEMARRLTATGENIDLLVMIDSYPPLQYAPLAERLGVYARRAARLLQSPGATGHATDSGSLGIAFTPAMQRVQECAAKALRSYRPRHYHGRIRFVRAGTPLHFPDDPAKVWSKFTDQFEVETVPGNHHELLTTHCESLAGVISRYLHELSVERPSGSSH